MSLHVLRLSRVRSFNESPRTAAASSTHFFLARPLSRETSDGIGHLSDLAERKLHWVAFSLGLTGYMYVGVVTSGRT